MLVGLIVAIDWQVQDASPFDGGQNVRHDLENLSYFMKDHRPVCPTYKRPLQSNLK